MVVVGLLVVVDVGVEERLVVVVVDVGLIYLGYTQTIIELSNTKVDGHILQYANPLLHWT